MLFDSGNTHLSLRALVDRFGVLLGELGHVLVVDYLCGFVDERFLLHGLDDEAQSGDQLPEEKSSGCLSRHERVTFQGRGRGSFIAFQRAQKLINRGVRPFLPASCTLGSS